MNKPPAFQFYPQDYLSSSRVAEMTLEEEGAYIRLLCYCWSTGSIPADPERCAKLAGKGCSIETATNVQRAFNVRSTDGQRLLHDRLEKEREKQEKHRELASFAGKKSAESRAKKHAKHSVDTTSNGRSTGVQRKVNSSSSTSVEDGDSSERKNRRCTSEQDPEFEEFWKIYPRKERKGNARKAWVKAIRKTDVEAILIAADRYAKQKRGKDQEFVAHPATWLNGEGWDDETLKPKDPFWYLALPPEERDAVIRAEMAKP